MAEPQLTPIDYDPFAPKKAAPPPLTGPKLTPVEGDPFAATKPPSTGPKLTPVEGDPFAATKPAATKPAAPQDAASLRPKLTAVDYDPFKAASPENPHPVARNPFESLVRDPVGTVGGKIREQFEGGVQGVKEGVSAMGAAPDLKHGVGGYLTGESRRLGKMAAIPGAALQAVTSPLSGAINAVSDPLKESTSIPERTVKGTKLPAVEGIDLNQALMAMGGETGFSKLAAARGAEAASSARTAASTHIYGNERAPTTRLDNALYRAQGGTTADKLEIQEFLKRLPKEVHNPVLQERLYHELEYALVDPKRQLSPEARAALAHFEPYYKEQTALINKIREKAAKGGHDVEPYLEDQGYVARRAVGHTPGMDALEGSRDPITGRSLTRSTTALKARQNNIVITGPDGKAQFMANAPAEMRPGMEVDGHKIRAATTKEIEEGTRGENGEPGVEYHKNAMVNTLDNVVKLRQVDRNIDLLDAGLKDMKAKGLAHREEWTYKNDRGETVQARAKAKTPEGFVDLPNIPQLKGWKFSPEVAEVFKDYKPPPGAAVEDILTKVNRGITSTLFWNPLPHAWNVANHAVVARGFDWMTPGGYKNLVTSGARAVMSVLNKDENYRSMLREGSGLQYGNTQTQNFYDTMLRKGVREFSSDPASVRQIGASFGLKDLSPAKLTKAIYSASNKILWGANDIFLLQRQYELMQKGMGAREAIAAAEKDIPNYRIPSRVLGSRAMSEALRNPNMMMFGRYRYGQIKAWGSMFRDMYAGSGEERTEAAGKFLVAAILAGGAYPLADAALQKVTGNDKARVHRGGGFTPVDAATQLSQGQKTWMGFIASVMEPAPATRAAVEAATNKDALGRPIASGTPKQAAVQAGEWAAGYVPPAQMALDAVRGKGLQALGRQAMLDVPDEDADAKKMHGEKFRGNMNKARARKDPILQALGGPGEDSD